MTEEKYKETPYYDSYEEGFQSAMSNCENRISEQAKKIARIERLVKDLNRHIKNSRCKSNYPIDDYKAFYNSLLIEYSDLDLG